LHIRNNLSVEGKSEWKFVEQVLQPHFANLEVYIKLHNMKTNKNKSGIQLGFQTAISYQLIDQKVI
jgi:hypothetical protein